MESRGELSFYYSKEFSTNRNSLYEVPLNIYDVEKEIWDKRGKIGFIPNLFFWWNNKKILTTVAQIVKLQIEKSGSFFGVIVP